MNIAFFGYENNNWIGGINYLKNLLYSIQIVENKKYNITPFIFFKENYDESIKELFEPYAKCVFLNKYNPVPFLLRLIDKIFRRKTNFFINYYLLKYKIDIVSHSEIDYGKIKKVKKIGWIPDFQDKHLPHLFSISELNNREIKYKTLIKHSDILICSSHDAAKDLNIFYPGSEGKTKVLQFVAQINPAIYDIGAYYWKQIKLKYNILDKFFFLPNKFYKHKNHMIVFEAVCELKKEGLDVLIVCTGEFSAFESEDYIDELRRYIDYNNLNENIKILGLISHEEVQFFLRHSVSVINPSLFEGWSTSVEECKSLGKNMIISDISVHREQNPPDTIYFNPADAKGFSYILKSKWLSSEGGPDYNLEKNSIMDLQIRMKKFGESYIQILNEASSLPKIKKVKAFLIV